MRKGLAIAAALVTALLPATAAWGHASVRPSTVAAGNTVEFVVRVPNESAPAATTAVEVIMPGVGAVSADVSGSWVATVTPAEGGTSVRWSGGRIEGTSAHEFRFTATIAPDRPRIVLPVLQTYSDGEVVRWMEDPDVGDPDHPAPVVTVTGATSASITAPAPTSPGEKTPSDRSEQEATGDGPATWVVLAVPVALVGIVSAIVWARRRR